MRGRLSDPDYRSVPHIVIDDLAHLLEVGDQVLALACLLDAGECHLGALQRKKHKHADVISW